MKINFNREKFLAAFQIAAAVAPVRSPKEILNFIKLDATSDKAILMATDREAGVRIIVEDAEIQKPGKVLLPVQKMGNILRENGDERLTIEVNENSVDVTGANAGVSSASSKRG